MSASVRRIKSLHTRQNVRESERVTLSMRLREGADLVMHLGRMDLYWGERGEFRAPIRDWERVFTKGFFVIFGTEHVLALIGEGDFVYVRLSTQEGEPLLRATFKLTDYMEMLNGWENPVMTCVGA